MSAPFSPLPLPTAALAGKAPIAAAASAVSGASGSPTEPKLVKVAQQFEALFVRQMLAAAHKSNMGDTLFSSQAGDTFRDLQDQRFADIAAQKGDFGMARMIIRQLTHQSRASAAPASSAAASSAATSKTGG